MNIAKDNNELKEFTFRINTLLYGYSNTAHFSKNLLYKPTSRGILVHFPILIPNVCILIYLRIVIKIKYRFFQ